MSADGIYSDSYQRMVRRVEEVFDDLDQERKLKRIKGRDIEKLEEVKTLPKEIVTDFWCESCQRDWRDRQSQKTIAPINLLGGFFAFWWSKCPKCGEAMRRFINFKFEDPYYRHSRFIRIQRNRYYIEMLSPFDPRYKTFHDDPFAEMEDFLVDRDKKKHEEQTKDGFSRFL